MPLPLPGQGLYLYASTEEILQQAMAQIHLPAKRPKQIKLACGDILQIAADGSLTHSRFDDSNLSLGWYYPMWGTHPYGGQGRHAQKRPIRVGFGILACAMPPDHPNGTLIILWRLLF